VLIGLGYGFADDTGQNRGFPRSGHGPFTPLGLRDSLGSEIVRLEGRIAILETTLTAQQA